MKIKLLLGVLCGFAVSGTAYSDQYIFPREGQSAEQQDKDEYYCHNWSTKQTGYDPTRPPPAQSQAPAQAAPGSGARGALGGAGRAWIISEVAGGDNSDAMAAGAIMGGLRGRRQSRSQQQQAQASAAASGDAFRQDYLRARAACLEAKGYTVK